MDAIETLKEDVRQGRIDADRLVDLVVALQRQLHAANQRLAQLEKQLGGSPTAKVDARKRGRSSFLLPGREDHPPAAEVIENSDPGNWEGNWGKLVALYVGLCRCRGSE